jgi:transposase-like protein
MYSYEDRIKAVRLYAQYGKRAAAVIRELGYPNRHILAKWYQEFVSEGDLKKAVMHKPKYTDEQRAAAVEFYLSHGKNMNLTIHVLG